MKLIKNNIIANASPQLKNKIAVVLNCKTGTLNKAEGGRIGFAFGSVIQLDVLPLNLKQILKELFLEF